MSLCWPKLCLLLSLITTPAIATNISIPAELSSFIPACAQQCFKSFLNSNFPSSVCTGTPTLACLCSNNSTSGYTVGEGAVQCIVSESRIGGCQGADAKAEVVVEAYTICNSQANALPNTHSTLTATLILQSSMPSVVLVPQSVTTTASMASVSQTSSLASITSHRATTFTTISTQTTTNSPTYTSATTTSSTAQVASETASLARTLTEPQIVGITVASIGGAALVAGILILLACYRRRKRARDSDILPFQTDPFNSYVVKAPSAATKQRRGPGGTANGIAAKLAPQVPPRIETRGFNMFARRSRPDTVGLAVSQDPSNPTNRRHISKLLPEKPTLSLEVPTTRGALNSSLTVPQNAAINRQSTATQFEEDFADSADTAVAGQEYWGPGSAGSREILNNQTGNWGTIRSVPPEPATPSQIIIPSSDWKPQIPPTSKTTPELGPAFKVEPVKLGRNIGSFSRPLAGRTDPFPRPPPPAQLKVPTQTTRPVTQSSSFYSPHDSLPPGSTGRGSSLPQKRSNKQSGAPDRQNSTGSLTSFETVESAVSPHDPEPKTAGTNWTDLSPVVESPASGQSPVSYPKIPGRLSRDYILNVPPPPPPDFAATLANQGGMKPWEIAEINAQRERNRIQAPAERQSQTEAQVPGAGQPSHRQQRNYTAPLAASTFAPPKTRAPGPKQPALGQSGPLTQYAQDSRSSSMASQNSNSSSLLAKRRGERKAQTLKLMSEDDKKRQLAKWRVLKDIDIERAKSPGWRPQLAGGEGVHLVQTSDLPRTPGWMPKLTPTRRGDELFLSVN